MDEEDFRPRAKNSFTPRDLSSLSVSEMEDYIAELNEEIERVKKDIVKKQAHRDSIDSFFKN